MLYGLSTHLFAREKLSKEHLTKISDNGISTIEIFANSHQIDFSDFTQLKNIESAVSNNNLVVNSVHAPFYFSLDALRKNGEVLNIADSNEDFRQKSIDEIIKSFVLSTLFPVDYFVLHFPDNANKNILLNSIDTLLKLSSDLGFKLAFENIPGNKTSVKDIVNFIEDNMIPVGICFDSGHSNMENSVIEDIANYGHLFYTTHIHDNDGIHDSHSLPFTGNINWQMVNETFKSVYYKWGFIAEVRQVDNNIDKTFKLLDNAIDKYKSIEYK